MGDQVEVLRQENNKLKKQIFDITKDCKSLKKGNAVKPRMKQCAKLVDFIYPVKTRLAK